MNSAARSSSGGQDVWRLATFGRRARRVGKCEALTAWPHWLHHINTPAACGPYPSYCTEGTIEFRLAAMRTGKGGCDPKFVLLQVEPCAA